MDITKFFSFLNDNNINLNDVVKLLTTVFGNSQNQNTESLTTPPPPKSAVFDANNPYWSTPTYNYENSTKNSGTMQSTMQSIVPINKDNFPQKTQNFNQNYNYSPLIDDNTSNYNFQNNSNYNNYSNIYDNIPTKNNIQNNNLSTILQLLIPLLQQNKKEPPTVAHVQTQNSTESEILKLKKT